MILLKVGRETVIQCLICPLQEGCRYNNKKVAVTIIEAILHRYYAKCLFWRKFTTNSHLQNKFYISWSSSDEPFCRTPVSDTTYSLVSTWRCISEMQSPRKTQPFKGVPVLLCKPQPTLVFQVKYLWQTSFYFLVEGLINEWFPQKCYRFIFHEIFSYGYLKTSR